MGLSPRNSQLPFKTERFLCRNLAILMAAASRERWNRHHPPNRLIRVSSWFFSETLMIWYVFDMTGFSEPLHNSLTRAFMRQSRREVSGNESHLFASSLDHEPLPPTYYLSTDEGNTFARMIRQFGGRRCGAPSRDRVQEIAKDRDPRSHKPEVDAAPC